MFRNFRNHKIEAYATINAVKKPTARIPKSLVCKYGITLIKSNVHARNIRGTAIIKVKSAAAFLDMPSSRLPAIVLPLLENPGQRKTLEKSDFQCLSGCNPVDISDCKFFPFLFCENHKDTAKYKANDNCIRAEKLVLYEIMEYKSHKTGRKH